eukprot:2745395-Amphidinium_carterae.1
MKETSQSTCLASTYSEDVLNAIADEAAMMTITTTIFNLLHQQQLRSEAGLCYASVADLSLKGV